MNKHQQVDHALQKLDYVICPDPETLEGFTCIKSCTNFNMVIFCAVGDRVRDDQQAVLPLPEDVFPTQGIPVCQWLR